jgi:hypothetical protein
LGVFVTPAPRTRARRLRGRLALLRDAAGAARALRRSG